MKARDVLPYVLTGSVLSVVGGIGYIIDCRLDGGPVEQCWLTGLPIAGIGAGIGSGYKVGFETLNPSLRRKNDEQG
jgi:hypothetical protein